jgi:hypothetical protein
MFRAVNHIAKTGVQFRYLDLQTVLSMRTDFLILILLYSVTIISHFLTLDKRQNHGMPNSCYL